ncbi:MAG: mechanosensitive ion channel family protein [Chromatiaceae bacterium]|nr:mechanosensitive ion channel family protein [Chromatiaceae bacterium]
MNAWLRASRLLLLWLCLSAPFTAPGAATEKDDTATWSTSAESQMKQINTLIKDWQREPPTDRAFAQVQQEIAALRERAERCVSEYETGLAGIQQKISALGEPDSSAAAEVRDALRRFQQQQQTTERQLAVCRLIELNARETRDQMLKQRRQMFSRALLHRERPVWQTFSDIVINGLQTEPAKPLVFEPWPALGVGLILLSLLLPVALMFGQVLREQFPLPGPDEPSVPRKRNVLADMYGRRAPALVVFLAVTISLYVGGAAPLAGIGGALVISVIVAPLLQLFVCHGNLQCPEGLPARLLLVLIIVAMALKLFGIGDYLAEDALLLLRATFLFALVMVALWLVQRLIQRKDLETLRSLRLPIAIALLAGPLAEWLGYLNLGWFLTLGVYGTGTGLLLSWWLLTLFGLLFNALGDADNELQSGARQWLGYRRGERVPGLSALKWLVWIGTLIALGYWLLFSWQVSASDTGVVRDLFTDGFSIGAVRIVPVKLIAALFAFLVLLTLARWLRQQLGERWLTKTTLDAGARQSVVALTSYTIVGIAIMLALSMAGLDFQNIAIVAGALSVGIGFGLQNIVNNFVSGLILLFERPVRPGDWVIVGGTEGYVRKVSIRYTLIQTFDRAEVLVPNSELISNQVTNLMLTDTFGRVRVPVGVAYGSDTRQVRDILHRVAREHPMVVLHDPRVASPLVYFIGFGDSSLDFELRCFISNIDYKMSVRSDLLFAIDDAFREAGIEIPFPQRVVHMQKDVTGEDPRPEQDRIQ